MESSRQRTTLQRAPIYRLVQVIYKLCIKNKNANFNIFLRTNLDKTLTDGAPLLTCYYTEECLLMGKYSEFVISLLFHHT